MPPIQRLTPHEFAQALYRKGCEPTDIIGATGRVWRTADDVYFQVPAPRHQWEGQPFYPDWILFDLIHRLKLPPETDPN